MLAAHCRLSGSIGFEIVAADPPEQARDVRSAARSAEEGSTTAALADPLRVCQQALRSGALAALSNTREMRSQGKGQRTYRQRDHRGRRRCPVRADMVTERAVQHGRDR